MRRSHSAKALTGILAAIAVLVIAFVVIGVGMGWIEFADDTEKSTIQLNKVEMQADTDEAVDATKNAINDTAESVDEAVSDEETEVEAGADKEPDPLEVEQPSAASTNADGV